MARVPEAASAVVADEKLSKYLLNMANPQGAAKARFLEGFGFSIDRIDELRDALLAHIRDNDVTTSQQSRFGAIFEVEGRIGTPDGRDPLIRSVWMIDAGAVSPRLITLVPRTKRVRL